MAQAVRKRLSHKKINIVTRPTWDSSKPAFPVTTRKMTDAERQKLGS